VGALNPSVDLTFYGESGIYNPAVQRHSRAVGTAREKILDSGPCKSGV